MRRLLILLLAVSGWSVSGCVHTVLHDTPGLTATSFESGKVLRVDLVAPSHSTGCGWGYCYAEVTGKRTDAVALRGPFGRIDLRSDWTMHSIVLLDDGDKVEIISPEDIGLVPGERVRLGFEDSPADPSSDRVALSRSDDELRNRRVKEQVPIRSDPGVLLTSGGLRGVVAARLTYVLHESEITFDVVRLRHPAAWRVFRFPTNQEASLARETLQQSGFRNLIWTTREQLE